MTSTAPVTGVSEPPAPETGAPSPLLRYGLTGIATSIACFLTTALLGPSAHQPSLPGPGPVFALAAAPSPYLVTGLVVAGILTGSIGLALSLLAAGRGARIAPRPLLIAGLLATAAFSLMPPVGSTDHLNYAAYGRMAVTGHNPYTTAARDLPGDPIADAAEEWRRAPSIYGPIVTGQEAFAAWVGDGSLRVTVLVLSLTNGAAFALTGLLLYRTAGRRTGRDGRLRAVLLWTANPLLLFHLVSGAHNDTLGIAAAVAALGFFAARRPAATAAAAATSETSATGAAGATAEQEPRSVVRALWTGACTGAAVAIKLPAGLVGGGPAWALLRGIGRRPGALSALVVLFGSAGAVAVAAYALAGSHAFDQVAKASRAVSLATPWHLVMMATGGDRTIVRIGAVVLLLALAWLLVRALPWPQNPHGPHNPHDPHNPLGPYETYDTWETAQSLRVSAALVLAWLFAAPYALPWYDGLGWAVLVLLPWSRFDGLLLLRTAALSLAYLPARDPDLIKLPDDLSWLITVVRPVVIPIALTLLLMALVAESARAPRRVPAPVRSPRA